MIVKFSPRRKLRVSDYQHLQGLIAKLTLRVMELERLAGNRYNEVNENRKNHD